MRSFRAPVQSAEWAGHAPAGIPLANVTWENKMSRFRRLTIAASVLTLCTTYTLFSRALVRPARGQRSGGLAVGVGAKVPRGVIFNALEHGLQNDGEADNTALLQDLINYIGNAGGGTIVFPPGVYVVTPGTSTRINLRSNVTLRGEGGATIKVSAASGDYDTIVGQASAATPITNVVIEGLTFDQNTTGNTRCAITANDRTRGQTVISLTNAPSIRIMNCNFDPCSGVNTVNISGNTVDALVTNNRFNFVRGTSPTEYDNSAVYMNCQSHRVTGNYFYSSISQHARAAIESHNGQSVVTGNVSDGYQTLCNVVSASGPVDSRECSDVTVTGNTCSRANFGVKLWSITDHTLRNVTVVGNTISLSQAAHGETNSSGVQMVYQKSGLSGAVENVTISTNTIRFQSQADRSKSRQGLALNESGTYAIGIAPAGDVSNVTVTGNTICNAPVQGVTIGNALMGNTVSNVQVFGNLIVDAGQDRSARAGYRAAFFLVGRLVSVRVENNQVIDTGSPTTLGNQSLYYNPSFALECSFRGNHVRGALRARPGLTKKVNEQALDLGPSERGSIDR